MPLAAWAVLRGLRRREAELEAFGEPGRARPGLDAWATRGIARRRAWLQVAAVALGLLALARPQLGERQAELARTGRDLLLVLDLSRSMTVTDVAPNRLAAAKAAAWETVSASPGDRVGLIVFGGSAFLQLPLTSDHAALKLFLDAASPDDLADPGHRLGTALATAGKVFEHEGDRGHRAVLLVSDGESGEGDLEAATKSLRAEAIPVFALGVGTTGGGPVPADSSEAPEKFHRDHIGRIAISRLEEDELRTVGQAHRRRLRPRGPGRRTGRGSAQRWRRCARACCRRRSRRSGPTGSSGRSRWRSLALLGDLALAVGRRAAARFAAAARGTGRRAGARSHRAAAVAARARCVAGPAPRRAAARRARRAEGRAALRRRRLRRLGARRSTARSRRTARLSGPTTRATRTTGMRRYEDAAARYRLAAAGPQAVRQPSVFNLGNSLVRAAEEAPERGQLLLDAIAAYEEALRLDPTDQDAKWNLELALKRLEEDRMAGGSSGRGRQADYGRGNMNVPGYEGNPEAAIGSDGGRWLRGRAGRVRRELDADQARQLLEAVQREQLASHEGRRSPGGGTGDRDW